MSDDVFSETEENTEERRFEEGCYRIFVVYIVVYLLIGVASTVFSVITGTHWWVAGWLWPFAVTIVAVSIGAVQDK